MKARKKAIGTMQDVLRQRENELNERRLDREFHREMLYAYNYWAFAGI